MPLRDTDDKTDCVAKTRRSARGEKDGAIITSLKSFYRDVQRRDKYEIVQKAMVAVEAFEDWNSNGKLLSDNGLYETTLDGQIVFRKASVTDHVI